MDTDAKLRPLGAFGQLTRNPLGVIGLFIFLVYSVAGAVTAVSGSFPVPAVYALVGFVVVFPIIIISVFVILVIWHLPKMYGPQDYRSDDAFFAGLAHGNVQLRVRDTIEEHEEAQKDAKQNSEETKSAAAQVNNETTGNSIAPALAPSNKQFIPFIEIAALRYLSSKISEPLKFDVSVGRGVSKAYFDAAYVHEGRVVFVEIKVVKKSNTARFHLERYIAQVMRAAQQTSTAKFRLVIVYGFPDSELEKFKAKVKELVAILGNVEVEYIAQQQLLSDYGAPFV